MAMRWILLLSAAACGLCADRRNTDIPNTDTRFVMPRYADLKSWQARRESLRRQVAMASGLVPMREKTPLNPVVTGRLERNGYTVEKVALETMPGYWLGGNLYRPRGIPGRHPVILHPHGHWTYGRLENSENCSGPVLASNLARQGFAVFAYDMAGYNDTVQTTHDFGTPREWLWGFHPFALQTWNTIRALDFVESLPDADPARIGITGASGGGTQTFILTAVDGRIQAAVPVNMVSLAMQGGCVCENAPGLRLGTNNAEITALFAPKPMLIVAATGDWTRNVPREEFPGIRGVYALFQKPEAVEAVQFDAPHNYHRQSREAMYAFFAKHFLGREGPVAERGGGAERLQDMLVWHGRPLPAQAKTHEQIFEYWREQFRRGAAAEHDPETLRAWLRSALGAEWPERVSPEGGVLSRPGAGDAVPYKFLEGRGAPALYLAPGGIAEAERSGQVKQWRAEGRPVLLIDAFQTGSAKAARDTSHRHFLTFNVSQDAARAQDAMTALAWLATRGTPEIGAHGAARWWALFAAAASPIKVRMRVEPGEFAGSDGTLLENFNVPGIQRAGGVETALRLLR
jgi:dienelactone hydrolase